MKKRNGGASRRFSFFSPSPLRRALAGAMAALLTCSSVQPAEPPSVNAPSLNDALPHPRLTRDRLHAALALLSRGDASLPTTPWNGPLSNAAILRTGPFPAPDRPVLVLVESPLHPEAQAVLRDVLNRPPFDSTDRLYGPTPWAAVPWGDLRAGGDASARKAAADLMLELGALPAAVHRLLTRKDPEPLRAAEGLPAFRRYARAEARLAAARKEALDYAEILERSLEPVEQRLLDLKLWALERNRAAFISGELGATDYLQRLLDHAAATRPVPESGVLQAKRLMELATWERGLDFEQARRERDALVDRLHARSDRRGTALLMQQTADFAEGRSTPARYVRQLFEAARRTAVPAGDVSALSRFGHYAEAAESLDFSALAGEVRRLEDVLFGATWNTPSQAALLRVAQDVRSLRRALHDGFVPDGTLRDPWRTAPDRARALAETVGLTIPQPAFDWPTALAALEELSDGLRERGAALARNVMKGPDRAPRFLILSPAMVRPVQDALSSRGLEARRLLPLPQPNGQAPAAAALLARAWGLSRTGWDETEPSLRASALLWGNLMLLFQEIRADQNAGEPAPPEAFLRRFRVTASAARSRRGRRGGELRVRTRGEGLPPSTIVWRWSSPGTPDAGQGFHGLGEVSLDGKSLRLFFRVDPGFRGPWRWGRAQLRAAREATRRFFQMQRRAALFTGAWMAGGVALSAVAGAISAAFIVLWMAVGVLVLIGVVVFGRNPSAREGWLEGLKTWKRDRRAEEAR